jgi:hypothetical protein
MRKRMATAAAVALLAVALGGVVRTATAGPSPATTEIVVVIPGDTTVGTFLDFDEDGITQGDRAVFRGELWDPAESHRMGWAKAECVVVSNKITNTTGKFRCSHLLKLAGGDLIVEGLDPHGPSSSMFAILGGTAAYSTASGDADVVDTASRTEFHLHVAT